MKRKLAPWLIGMVVATLLMAALLLWATPQYAYVDDANINLLAMGYGAPATYLPYVNCVLTWLLYGLTQLFPGFSWFSAVQLAALWFSFVIVLKSLMQSAEHHRLPGWTGLVAGMLCIGALYLPVCVKITYTVTAAILGAAGCLQILSADYREASTASLIRSLLLAAVLLAAGYCLRPQSGIVSLPFACGTLAVMALRYRGKRHGRPMRPLLIGFLAIAVSFSGLYALQANEIRRLDLHNTLARDQARIGVMDYLLEEKTIAPENYAAVGWSTPESKLILARWYQLDQDASIQSFKTIMDLENAQRDHSLAHRISEGVRLFRQGIGEFSSPSRPVSYGVCLLATQGLLFLAALALLLAVQKGRRLWLALFAVGVSLLCVALCGYLAYTGRVPLRAMLAALLPANFLLVGLLFHCADGVQSIRYGKAVLAIVTLWLVVVAGLNVSDLAPFDATYDDNDVPFFYLMQAYGRENPELLLLANSTLFCDFRLFLSFPEGMPQNIAWWGGWPCRLPSQLEVMARFGVDGNAFTAADYLREDVAFVTADPLTLEWLWLYISEKLYPACDPNVLTPVSYQVLCDFPVGERTLYICQFYLDEELALLLEP